MNYQASRPIEEQRKLSPMWEGPCPVTVVIENGAYKLQTLEGKEILNVWNAQHLKKNFC